ncbi:AAA family ATPase [Mameliella alba]|nr:AAA family ATPase [Mameliella alba]MBY6172135.1 AAA family ATPase [Mameliella alba]MBY6177231.1 AAA family ATPase [Mameliella alba]
MTNHHGGQQVVPSGCSGGGKAALLAELASRGCETVEAPGRKIVQQELNGAGVALPWPSRSGYFYPRTRAPFRLGIGPSAREAASPPLRAMS